MHKSPFAANNTGSFEKAKLSQNSETQQEAQDESNRYCEKNRRPRARCHTKGDPQDNENPGGRPLADNIDTGYPVLYELGIRSGEVHREMNTEEPPSALCRRRVCWHIQFTDTKPVSQGYFLSGHPAAGTYKQSHRFRASCQEFCQEP